MNKDMDILLWLSLRTKREELKGWIEGESIEGWGGINSLWKIPVKLITLNLSPSSYNYNSSKKIS